MWVLLEAESYVFRWERQEGLSVPAGKNEGFRLQRALMVRRSSQSIHEWTGTQEGGKKGYFLVTELKLWFYN